MQTQAQLCHIESTRCVVLVMASEGGTVIASAGYLFSTTSAARADARAVERMVSLTVNGKTHKLDVPPNETLAMTIP